MHQDNTDKNEPVKNTIKILIPAFNEYLLKDVKYWAKSAYAHARRQVHWRKAKKIKGYMPIETAAYAEDKVFGNWRLVAPSADNEKSPLQQVITLIRDEIVPTRWGEFRRKFVCELKLCFNAICDADYDQKMVDEVNQRINQLISRYTRGVTTPRPPLFPPEADPPSEERGSNEENPPYQRGTKGVVINFVLLPETAEDYSSLKNLTIRSGIWMRWTGVPLDFSQFIKPPGAKPLSRQMEMYLSLSL
jgi:hypothetical protein